VSVLSKNHEFDVKDGATLRFKQCATAGITTIDSRKYMERGSEK